MICEQAKQFHFLDKDIIVFGPKHIVEATCTMAGMYMYKCYDCSETVEAVEPALGHSFVLDESKGGMSITEGVDGKKEFTLYLKCINGCSYSRTVVADSFDEIEIPATCTESAMIEYTNIKLKDGTVLTVSDGVPLRIICPKGSPLGHSDGVVVYGKYNIDDLSAENVTLINGLDFSCKDYDGSNDDAWKDAVYLCPDCNTYIAIKVCKSHTATDGAPLYYEVIPTCTTAGILNITCRYCCDEGVPFKVAVEALGHDKIYTYTENNAGNLILSWRCDRPDCGAEGMIADVESLNVVSESDCKRTGSAVAVVDGETITITLEKSEYHKHRGMFINGTKENPVNFIAGMIEINDGLSCTIENVNQPNAAFWCDICNNYTTTYAITEHTYLTDLKVEPTCAESGLANYKCSTCSLEVNDVVIPALGHQLDWKILSVSKTRVVIDIVCLHDGCKMHRDFKTSANDYTDFSSEDGMIVVDLAKETAQGWDVQTIISGNCSISGIYRFTFVKEFEKSGIKFVFDTPIAFDIEIKTAHDLIDDISCSYNGASYIGKYCKECGKIVEID